MEINFSLVSTKLIIHVILLEKIRLNHHQLIEMSSVTIDDKKNSFASDFSLCPLEENKEQKIDIELDLSFSQLTSLPENLPNSLQKLYCSSNQITKLPENLPSSLQKLSCSNNPYLYIPKKYAIRFNIKET